MGDGSPISSKQTALQQLVEASIANDHSIWTKVCSFDVDDLSPSWPHIV